MIKEVRYGTNGLFPKGCFRMTITRSMRSLIVSIPTACLALLLAVSAPSPALADEADAGTAGHGAIAAAAAGGSAGSSSAPSGASSGAAGSGAIAALAGGASGESAAAADDASDESGDAAASSPATSFSTSGLSGGSASVDAATAGTASGSTASSTGSASSGDTAASSSARFAGLSSLAASLTGGPTDVQQAEGFSYTVSAAGTATIVEYSGAGGAVEIPTSIDGYAVTAIGDGAFGGNGAITSVVLPEGVTSIGNLAFAECPSLAEISLPEGVSFIGYGAFYNDDLLTSIALPASLARCGAGWGDTGAYGPFGACDGLVEVTLAEGMATVPADLLTGCPAAVTVDVPATVTAVGSNAFAAAVPASICGAPGSFAESYAAENGLAFTSNVVPATAVTLGETSSQLAVDETCQLTATVEPANTTDKLTWSTSDESVATVDAAGLVSARGAGTATITAAAGAVSATCEVRVVQPVESISLNKKTLELEATETRLLQPQILPDNATDKGLVWSSSDESVATVDAAGVVTAVGKGEAQITAVAADGYGAQASCSITVTNDATIATSVEQLASPADYGDNRDDIWLYTLPGAQSISVTFDTRTNVEDGFDFVDVYDGAGRLFGRYTGASLAGKTLVLEGDTVKIKLVTDASTTEWGFGVTSVAAVQTEGWQVIDGVTYYYIDGAPARGELLLADGWHYFNENTGAMVTGLVTLPDGRIVYYDARGVMLTGEVLLADGWHYFDPVTGCMAVGLTMMPDHTWRYYDYAGVMRTGDVSIGNTVYHFDQNTGIMVDSDVTINDVDITQNETNITNNTVVNVTIEEGTRADDDTEPTPDFNGDNGEGTGTPGEPAEGEEPAGEEGDQPAGEEGEQPAEGEEMPAGEEGDQPAEDEQPAGEEGEQPAEGEEPAAEGEEPTGEPTGEEQADVPAEQEQPADTAPVEDATEPEQPVEEEPAQEEPVVQESDWGLTVGEDGHVVTDYFDFYLPSYWIGKVEVAFLPAAENNGIDAVVIYPAGYPSAVFARFEMFDSSTEINGGDIASGLAGYWDNGAGQRVELWQTRWTVLLANPQAREVGATEPIAGAEAQVVDLLTGGAYTLDQVYAAANESDAVAMGAFGDGALFPSVFVPHYAADGTVDGYAPCWGGDITQAPFSNTTIPASWYSLIEPLLPSEVVPAETQEPAAAEEAPVEEAAPAPEEAPAEESAPIEEVPVEEQAAPEEAAPAEEQAAPDDQAPVEETPAEEAASR